MIESLTDRIHEQILRSGPMPFETFVELALYDVDQGFYAVHGQAGRRRGDFITSVEVGPLFAAVIADWLDTVWDAIGRPDPFLVSEAGAGIGTLFRGIRRADPACLGSMEYTVVERSAAMRVDHQSLPSDRWRSSATLPVTRQHVIIANELLDNLGFGIAERLADGWGEVRVIVDDGRLGLRPSPAVPGLSHLDALASDVPIGSRVPVACDGVRWLDLALSRCDQLLVFDYGASTAELARRGQSGWLRTYAGHMRATDPLIDIGRRDITHDVPFDQLPGRPSRTVQAEWLQSNGLTQRVDAARVVWAERAAIGDLEAIAARSAVSEAEALTDPSGLGAFTVLHWETTR